MTELFEEGKSYTFHFSQEHGETTFTGKVLSYQSPLVKVETEGLTRIINCSSSCFVEAVARREDLIKESPDSEE